MNISKQKQNITFFAILKQTNTTKKNTHDIQYRISQQIQNAFIFAYTCNMSFEHYKGQTSYRFSVAIQGDLSVSLKLLTSLPVIA